MIGEITVLGSLVLVLLPLKADFGPVSSFGPLLMLGLYAGHVACFSP